MDRRYFLKKTGFLILISNLWSRLSFAKIIMKPYKGLLICPISSSHFTNDFGNKSADLSCLRFYNLETDEESFIEVPVGLAHSISPTGTRNEFFVIETDGPSGCVVNIKSKSVVHQFKAKESFLFSGHAIIAPDKKSVLISEYPVGHWDGGLITVRNLLNFEIKEEFSTGYPHPHDFAFNTDGSELWVAHYGKEIGFELTDINAPVVVLDFKTLKTKKIIHGRHKNQRLCHIIKGSDSDFYIGTSRLLEKNGKKFDELRSLQKDFKKLRAKGFFNAKSTENLESPIVYANEKSDIDLWLENTSETKPNISLCHDRKTDTLLVVHSYSKNVSFWRKSKLLGKFSFGEDTPIGCALTFDQEHFAVSTGDNKIFIFDIGTLEIKKKIKCKQPFSNGSIHLYSAAVL